MQKTTLDGGQAVVHVAYAFTELCFLYPITPSTPMSELTDEWANLDKKNLFGKVPKTVEMQSESGVAGAVHGALTCGALTTTYTCSQGLLLMLPDMYKIAGELLPAVFHVSARALSTHALSIFGDHQDVMACRQSGFAFLASSSVQEAADMALVAHLCAIKSSLPFLHFFDGFRTSHEVQKIEIPTQEEMRGLLDEQALQDFRNRALSPDSPTVRGTAQNPDVYFQCREAANERYALLPQTVQSVLDEVARLTGRSYALFDYYGATDAERIVVLIGSAAETATECVDELIKRGEKVGVIKVRLYRPFATDAFLATLPKSCKKIAVLDRTKEPGSLGEPLFLDVCAALRLGGRTDVLTVGGRYGLGGKEFTPTMCYAVYENLKNEVPKHPFTVGIDDDKTHLSLDYSQPFSPAISAYCCKFYGLGSDGTVGANKNSIKILGNHTDKYVQGYFYYDSKKSGGITVSHLRISNEPIRSAYLIEEADFIACHNPSYLDRYDILAGVKEKGVFLLNCPWSDIPALEKHLPDNVKRQIAEKSLSFFVIDGTKIAHEAGLKGRTGTVMQAAFFLLIDGVLPKEKSLAFLKEELKTKFAKKGEQVVKANLAVIDSAAAALREITSPKEWKNYKNAPPVYENTGDNYCDNVLFPTLSMQGDSLPVSRFDERGEYPTGTTKHEARSGAAMLPEWIKENCIQCNQCAFVCPHATIRPFLFDEEKEELPSLPAVGVTGKRFRIQIVPEKCMGCGVCANTCPAKEKALVMHPAPQISDRERTAWAIAKDLAYEPPLPRNSVKGSQFYPPLFEYSYACAGCGETPYVRILTQLFGERLLIANATGCSSIYGASFPACPYTKNREGKGPAWASSLFEDNAEFGLGMRLACDFQNKTDQSVWLIGGDGWAYDIGYGGLDHVLSLGENVNVLLLDSEVYSNTGGQASKATQTGAVARFTPKGKRHKKKELGLMAMTYGNVYIAQVCMGANKQQLLTALTEAESYQGPSLIIAYSPCISHGANMSNTMEEEKRAVLSGYWNLYRYHPARKERGENPFILDSKAPTLPLREFLLGQGRFASLQRNDPETAEVLFTQAEKECQERFALLSRLAQQ